jgi:hypothetical protein
VGAAQSRQEHCVATAMPTSNQAWRDENGDLRRVRRLRASISTDKFPTRKLVGRY